MKVGRLKVSSIGISISSKSFSFESCTGKLLSNKKNQNLTQKDEHRNGFESLSRTEQGDPLLLVALGVRCNSEMMLHKFSKFATTSLICQMLCCYKKATAFDAPYRTSFKIEHKFNLRYICHRFTI